MDIVVEFEGENNFYMTHEMVNKLLIQNSYSVKNQAKSVIDLHLLEANVLGHSMVENAEVFLTIDGLLKTKITQRTPIARVVFGGNSYYIDKQAKLMPMSSNHSARVLLVSGDVEEGDIKEIFVLVTEILSDDFFEKQIIGMQKMKNSEFVLRTRMGDFQIEIGKIENLNQKFGNLKWFLKKAIADKTTDNYTSINLKCKNQVVCTKK